MLPDKDTIGEIFGIIKALNQSEKWFTWNAFKSDFKSGWTSLPSVLTIWMPCILFIIVLVIVLINPLLGNLSFLGDIGLCSLLLGLVSLLVGSIIKVWRSVRNNVNFIIDDTKRRAEREAQHVNEFYKYEPNTLKYVLVQLKARRAAWERGFSVIVGPLEKIGFIPALIALFAIYIRPEVNKFPAVWVQLVVLGFTSLYFFSLVENYQVAMLDRAITLLEMVIDNKKSTQSAQNTHGPQFLPLGLYRDPIL